MKIATTTVTQTANDLLNSKERQLHYLVIENNKGEKMIINVGQKTAQRVKQLEENEKKGGK